MQILPSIAIMILLQFADFAKFGKSEIEVVVCGEQELEITYTIGMR